MPTELKAGQNVHLTVTNTINREGARKTIERLFSKDKAAVAPIKIRSKNFKELPKRRGGTIWTKRPNKLHLPLNRGDSATIKITPQAIKDLASVENFLKIAAAK